MSADLARPEFVPPRANVLLRGLTDAQLAWVEGRLTPRDFVDGQHVFQQGDAGDEVFLICSGTVEVYVERDGRSFVLASLEPGDYFGEMALIDEAPRSASVRALGDVRVTTLKRHDLRATLDAPGGAIWPALIMEHAHQQNRRLIRTNEAIVAALRREIATAHLHRRLALVLTLVVALVTAYAFLVALFQRTSGMGLVWTSLGIAAGASLGAVVFSTDQPGAPPDVRPHLRASRPGAPSGHGVGGGCHRRDDRAQGGARARVAAMARPASDPHELRASRHTARAGHGRLRRSS